MFCNIIFILNFLPYILYMVYCKSNVYHRFRVVFHMLEDQIVEDLVAVSNDPSLVLTLVTSAVGVGDDDLGCDNIDKFVEGLIVDDDDMTALSLEQLA